MLRIHDRAGTVLRLPFSSYESVTRMIENTNDLNRQYRALNAQASYRVGTHLNAGASYTLSRLWGNVNGENIGSGPITSSAFAYPEFSDPSWSRPEGSRAQPTRRMCSLSRIPARVPQACTMSTCSTTRWATF